MQEAFSLTIFFIVKMQPYCDAAADKELLQRYFIG